MKYTNEIEINLPLTKVIELFDNPENMKHWQPGLQSFEPISGTPGQTGAKSRLKYQMGKRNIEMIETITKRNLPDEFSGTYEAKGVFNIISNKFIPLGPNKTKWVADNEFQFSGFMKLMGWLMPGAFKKQSQKYLEYFKEFAEKA
jgi:hypothetical protein